MNKIRFALFLLSAGLLISFFPPSLRAQVPEQASRVYVSGSQLILEKRLEDGRLDAPKPYIIKGLSWEPPTKAPAQGPNPYNPSQNVPYGFFFDWPGRDPQGHVVFEYWIKSQFQVHYLTDLALMRQMKANTVRVYIDFYNDIGSPQDYRQVLDECYCQGIMVIMTVALSREDIDSGRYLETVGRYKNHPAVLFWSLGNEWNMNLYSGAYASISEAALATNLAALNIKQEDADHPVSSCLGDTASFGQLRSSILDVCVNVDLWGLNIYRGQSFYNLFSQWQEASIKPFYLSEFGADSFRTTSFTVVSGRADNCAGSEDRPAQRNALALLWQEICAHLSAANPSWPCLGGLVHEFNDVLWKVGSYHVGLGGLVDYDGPDHIPGTADDDHSYDDYNSEGFIVSSIPLDGVANEEYFGVVDADRNPKEAFLWLKRYYAYLDTVTDPAAVDTDGDGIVDALESSSPAPDQTNLNLSDTDGDGLSDGREDSNKNGIYEPFLGQTNPRGKDTDADGLEDGVEVMLLQTDPSNPASPASFTDRDNDGLASSIDPDDSNRDTDGDRYLDSYEAVMLGLSAVSDPGARPFLGDVNNDYFVDNADSQLTLNYFAHISCPNFNPNNADVNRDGFIDNADSQQILNFFGRVQPCLPVSTTTPYKPAIKIRPKFIRGRP